MLYRFFFILSAVENLMVKRDGYIFNYACKKKKISILSLGTDLTVWILEIRFFAAMMCLSLLLFLLLIKQRKINNLRFYYIVDIN